MKATSLEILVPILVNILTRGENFIKIKRLEIRNIYLR